MGALVCFELARSLRDRKGPLPIGLTVSGRRAPQCGLSMKALSLLPDHELIAALPTLGGVTAELLSDPRWAPRFLPTVRADLAVSDLYVYQPQPPLACPILAFKGENDPILTTAELAAWRHQTEGACLCQELPGSHFFDSSSTDLLCAEMVANIDQWLCTTPTESNHKRSTRQSVGELEGLRNG
jgi:medium-chain acyl-[acyl-carrier-protein] hydrolase